MAIHVQAPAYQQIVQWYQHWQQVETARPIALLVTTGAPDEGANQPKMTSASTQLDVYA